MSNKRPRFRLVAAALSLALLTGLIAFGSPPTPAAAAPGNPGKPGAPTVLFEEDFENAGDGTNTLLGEYTGSDETTYTADEFWHDRALCNGIIVDRTSTRVPPDCAGDPAVEANGIRYFQWVTEYAEALGEHGGAANPTLNGAASASTTGHGADNQVQFRTAEPITLDAANRFVTFSVDALSVDCAAPSQSRLRFYLEDADGEQPMSAQAIDLCNDPRATSIVVNTESGDNLSAKVGTFPGDQSVLLSGDQFGIVLRNEEGDGTGNDGAFDNIRVMDVTPQLDKSFGPATAMVGGTSTLTFTVTNTSELGAKDGWSFTDNLPEGLVAVQPAEVGGNCTAETTVSDDGASISVADGQLAKDATSCTITVPVTSDSAGTYENCAENVSDPVGVDLPDCASVTFEPQEDFGCTPQGILFQSPTGVPPTQVIGIDMVDGTPTGLGTLEGRRVNAIAYNGLDDYIYGLDLQNDQMVRVGSGPSVVELGWPEGLPDLVVGDIDEDGRYWVTDGLGWWVIDLVPGSDSYGTIVEEGEAPTPAGLSTMGADWAHVPGTEALWSIGVQDTDSVLVKFDLKTHERTVAANLGVLGGNTFGAVYADPDGFLYGSDNKTGDIFRVDVAAGTVRKFSDGPASSVNDGARCAAAPIPIDFGDAPDSYGTTLADNGPRHFIRGIDVQSDTAPLMLGSKIDSETDGAPSDAADGDDAAGVGDEDGVTQPLRLSQTGPTTVSVTATNNRDQAATLAGWIDLDGNGTFDEDELVTTTVPAGSGTAAYPLEFGEFTGEGTTYARFRLFGESEGVTASPTGPAGHGEVEDYVVEDRDLSIEKTSDATEATRIGDTVKYTVTVTNTGASDFTDDAPAIIADDLSGVVDDATYNKDAEASSGEVTVDGDLLSWSGALASGDKITITYSVTITGAGDGELINSAFQPNCDPADEDCKPVTPKCEDGKDPKTGLPCDDNTVKLPELTVEKTADTTAIPTVGDTVTYTVKATNTGKGAYSADAPAVVIDDLSGVLDDATVDPKSVEADQDPAAEYTEPQISWTGALAPGETVTITYQVTYTGAGDHKLINVAFTPDNPDNPEPPVCDPADKNGRDPETGEPCAKHEIPAAGLSVEKSADPSSGGKVEEGQRITYTLTFENDGNSDAEVDYTDHLAEVLDDADVIKSAKASDPSLTVLDADDQYTVQGTLAAGKTVTVSYVVEVRAADDQGDGLLVNFLTETGEEPPAECTDGDPSCTTHETDVPDGPELPDTGAPSTLAALLSGLIMLAVGGVTVARSRRRKR
ncbi:DUF6923 family protein [Microlunatus sp. GCM10028923]|uniref:DUF7927 domain-containing protein n=1 Tax=Microlunatus sp. GCM10028923 TaxID=3273400 RepID=UPI00361E1B5F